jgi:hypothetical protein
MTILRSTDPAGVYAPTDFNKQFKIGRGRFVIALTSLFLSFALIRIKARCAAFQGVDFCPSSSTI